MLVTQDSLFTEPSPARAQAEPQAPRVPVSALKGLNPRAKKFFFDGTRFGIMSMRQIQWFVLHDSRRFGPVWLPLPEHLNTQPEAHTEHLFSNICRITGTAQ